MVGALINHLLVNLAVLDHRSDDAGETFQAAAANADWAGAKNYFVILTDQPGEASWPITGANDDGSVG